MDEKAGSESLFQRLFMRQLSLNWAVLSNIQNLLYMGVKALNIQIREGQKLVLEEVELSTLLDHKANTSEETNMNDQPEEKPEKKEKPKPIEFDAEKASELLDVVHDTADLPSLVALNQAAMINLLIMAAEVQEELDKRAEEARKKAEEESAKLEKKKQERLKEIEDEKLLAEKEERDKAEKAAREREAARQQKEPEYARRA